MGELLLVFPYTVDPFWRDSLAHVSLPPHPSICSSLGMRVNPDKSSIVSTRRGNETTEVLLLLLFGDKELEGEFEKRWDECNIVGPQWLNIHVMLRGNGRQHSVYIFTGEIVLKSTRLN